MIAGVILQGELQPLGIALHPGNLRHVDDEGPMAAEQAREKGRNWRSTRVRLVRSSRRRGLLVAMDLDIVLLGLDIKKVVQRDTEASPCC